MATEIVFLKVKPNYTPDEIKSSLQCFKPSPRGFQSVRWGPILDDPQTIVWLLNWESVESHEEYTISAIYTTFITKPLPITPLFGAGVIKISELAANTGTAGDESPLGVEVSKLVNAISKAPGYRSHYIGIKHEDISVCILLEGWDSTEAHDAAKGSKYIQGTLKYIEDLCDVEKSTSQFVRLHPDQLLEL